MEKLVLAADNSQISTFLECPRKWFYEYRLSIVNSAIKTIALDKGTIVHSLLDLYYKFIGMKEHPSRACVQTLEAFKKALKLSPDVPKVDPEDIEFITERFKIYVMHNIANDQEFRPLVIDGIPQVEMGFSIPLVDTPEEYFVVEGRIDLLTDNGFFVDHKSQDRFSNHYKFDTQFLTYAFATKLKNGMVNYFGLQDKLNPNSFRRLPLAFSSDHIEKWRLRMIEIFRKMASCIYQNNYPENESACPGRFNVPCQYSILHETLNPEVRNILIKSQFKERKKWVPWDLQKEI